MSEKIKCEYCEDSGMVDVEVEDSDNGDDWEWQPCEYCTGGDA